MLRIDLEYAKPGMSLALPVQNPQAPDRSLLAAGYELTGETIVRLQKLGVHEVLIRYPGLNELDRYISPRLLAQRGRIATELKKNLEQIQDQTTAKLPYDKYLQQMAALVEEMLSNRASMLFIDQARDTDGWLLGHSSSVAYLSLLMGLRLDGYLIRQRSRLPQHLAKEVNSLGVGAMLHDVGLLHLDAEVLDRYRETGDGEDAAWRAHTRLGYELVRGQIDPSAAIIALDHHQHYDGSGFPTRHGLDGRLVAPAGQKIHIFTRITTVADTFAEWRHSADGERVPTVRAMSRMLSEPCVRWFDPVVLRAFLEVVPPFAPGTPVRLNDGRWGVPIDHSPRDPCRPRIHMGVDPRNLEVSESEEAEPAAEVLDLGEHPELHVAEVEGCDVSGDNFQPPDFDGLEAEAAFHHVAAAPA